MLKLAENNSELRQRSANCNVYMDLFSVIVNALLNCGKMNRPLLEKKAMSYNFFVRAISEQNMVVATATFKDSASPILGMVTG
ncbi:hypothetical protein D3C87_1085470 [compost metagenome]